MASVDSWHGNKFEASKTYHNLNIPKEGVSIDFCLPKVNMYISSEGWGGGHVQVTVRLVNCRERACEY